MVPPGDIIKALSGAWLLLNNTSVRNGTLQPGSFGPPAYGILIYHPSGYMSANIMSLRPEDRPANLTWPADPSESDHDWAQIGKHAMSYAGPFSIDVWNETSGALIHGPLTFAAAPGWVNTPQKRNYTFFEEQQVLRLQSLNQKTGSLGTLFWRRLDVIRGEGMSGDNGLV